MSHKLQHLLFNTSDKVVELGGGSRPVFHPNLDVRKLPEVDIVADFNKPLMLESGVYDGLYSNFLIEHISFRSLKQFISECFRVLKPGGTAIFITANLYEQCKCVIEKENDETFDNQTLIFGGQGEEGIEAGSHKSSMTPKLALKLFTDAGFSEVKVLEHPVKTDMIIEVTK